MLPLSDDTCLALADNHLASPFGDDEVVFLNLERGTYTSLDGTGAFVWQALQEKPRTVDELTTLLQEAFDVDAATCRRDLHTFLRSLLDEKLIQTVDA